MPFKLAPIIVVLAGWFVNTPELVRVMFIQ